MHLNRIIEDAYFVRQIAKVSPDILAVFDLLEGRPIYFNRELLPVIGFSTENVLKRTAAELSELFHPDDHPKIFAFRQSFLTATDDEIKEVEYRIKTAWGNYVWMHVRGKVFKRDENGKVIQHLGIMRDITQQKKILEALIESEKLSAVGRISRMLAHEIRNPLTNINLALELLENELNGNDENFQVAKKYLEIINRNSGNIAALIRQILYSEEKHDDHIACIDLAEVLEETISSVKDRIVLQGISVKKAYAMDCHIAADKESIHRALKNIIINAIEAMEANKGIIEFFMERADGHVLLNIKDNGCGITAEQTEKIFQPFYSNKPSGLGMGLANVAAILKKAGAEIKVESKPGEGTIFSITVPLLRKSDLEEIKKARSFS